MGLDIGRIAPLRALITECAPYELPLEMADHWLYDWLDSRAESLNPERLKIRGSGRLDLLVLSLIGGITWDENIRHGESFRADLPGYSGAWRAPATFRVRRDRTRTRDLELMSSRSQLNVAFLYYKYKDVILHYVSVDSTSLRHPVRVNTLGKHAANALRTAPTSPQASVETASRSMSTFNSYFVYDKYAFAGQFYDSKEWHALEARWTHLKRLDIANCFRSIYTHSSSWSTGTDFFSKEHLGTGAPSDFGNALDSVMQAANWGETHGICIGPEVSRVFAEVVFQHLGLEIRSRVAAAGVSSGSYEILRYVDDYFIFTDELRILDTVAAVVESVLVEHKFSLNRGKTRTYTTPFTTSVSVKKANLKSFLRMALATDGEIPTVGEREISIQTKALLVGDDSDEANVGMSLTQVEKMFVSFLEKRLRKSGNRSEAEAVMAYAWSFVHDMLFQYLSNPSVASAMKVIRALRFYYLSPGLTSLADSEIAAVRFRVEEYVQFAITKALQRLVDVPDSDIELCHFLSLAGASGIRLEPTSKLVTALMRRAAVPSSRAKSNQSSMFLVLAIVKYFFSRTDTPGWVRLALLECLSQLADEILSPGFVPMKIQSHASQELFVLSIATCVWLSVDEKMRILRRPWLLQSIQANFYTRDGNDRASARFLRKSLEEFSQAWSAKVTSLPRVFEWSDEHFDKLLYEKQAQFVY